MINSALPSVGAGPRILLRQLREVMAQPRSTQQRLDKIVELIAANMVADVCSIYVRRASDELELFATKGLKSGAVHETRLVIGEGLVGEIGLTAEPLNLTAAPAHPKFVYVPETGEDPYQSFLGVPVLKGGHVLGVLVVQNRMPRHYDEEEVEALLTVAMILAEIMVSGQLINLDETVIDAQVIPIRPYRQKGIPFADGVVMGKAVLHASPIKVTKLIAQDIPSELDRLTGGLVQLRKAIDSMLSAADSSLSGEPRDVLEAYRMFANDSGWAQRMEEAVRSGLTAQAAVERVRSDTRARMSRQRDPYLRERLHDLDDLANRLLRILVGAPALVELTQGAVLLARNLGPAELLDYNPSLLGGVVLEEGAPTAHVAIVAKALEIPMVGLADGVLSHVSPGDQVVVDGASGEVHLRPDAEVTAYYTAQIATRQHQRAEFATIKDEPCVTLDGQRIWLNVNAGLVMDLPHLDEVGADGIGLFRTELQFMVSSTMPRLAAQKAFYRQVLEVAQERPVVFRTLDLGGDKILPYGKTRREDNPAMGLRAIRLALFRPALLRYQMRAFLMAAQGRQLNLMFPMVTEVSEFRDAKALLHLEMERLKSLGQELPASVRVGCMIEVPSLAWNVRAIAREADFVSVGSNDLMQFFFAVDRGNPQVSAHYDFLSPGILTLLQHIVRESAACGVPVSLCGEAAGRPLEAMALMGLGFRTISMPPACIGPVKLMARRLHLGKLQTFMDDLIDMPDRSLRPKLQEFAQNHRLPI